MADAYDTGAKLKRGKGAARARGVPRDGRRPDGTNRRRERRTAAAEAIFPARAQCQGGAERRWPRSAATAVDFTGDDLSDDAPELPRT